MQLFFKKNFKRNKWQEYFFLSRATHQVTLGYKKLSSNALAPKRSDDGSAGFDLSTAYHQVIPPRGKAITFTDLQLQLPPGCYGRIACRSSMASHHIQIGGGVIDRSFQGNVGIVLFNHSNMEFQIFPGQRVAQLILERIFEDVEVKEFKEDPPKTDRGIKGFGSTGLGYNREENSDIFLH